MLLALGCKVLTSPRCHPVSRTAPFEKNFRVPAKWLNSTTGYCRLKLNDSRIHDLIYDLTSLVYEYSSSATYN
jgi:hypothetical protein